MKTMTCQQLGGPCDHPHTGATADDVINAQDKHLRVEAKGGDEAHVPAHEAMKKRWRNPVGGLKWYFQAKKDFAALPEDEGSGRAS